MIREIGVSTSKLDDWQPLEASRLDAENLASNRVSASDAASLLEGLPGVTGHGAGGVSSLPGARGLANDRIRTKVDGMDLIPSCANHVNPVLSCIDLTKVGSVSVFAREDFRFGGQRE